jgi:hypothetical protein
MTAARLLQMAPNPWLQPTCYGLRTSRAAILKYGLTPWQQTLSQTSIRLITGEVKDKLERKKCLMAGLSV